MSAKSSAPTKGEVPQYRLSEVAYINDRLLQPGEVIYFEDPPGPHMMPLNDAAKAMVAKHKPTRVDPIESLTIVGPNATVLHPQRPGG